MTLGTTRLLSLEIRGFRAFGKEARTLDLDAGLVVVHASNSQGKSSLAEAIEFLISGHSSRRDLLGGAKAEYNGSLRNVHLDVADTDVYVQAHVRDAAGTVRKVRRELVCDFAQGTECESRLLVDGVEVADLGHLGLPLADAPVRAPVLLQHILRHVLSTEPKQRVGYFKSLLSLTDLDLFRERVRAARGRVESDQPGAVLQRVSELTGTPAAAAGGVINALLKKPLEIEPARAAVEKSLLEAGAAVLVRPDGTVPTFASIDALTTALDEALSTQREQVFPLSAITAAAPPDSPLRPDFDAYEAALTELDQHTAQLNPVLHALLSVEEYDMLSHSVTCPICGTEEALTPARIVLLREHLRRTQTLGETAKAATIALADARSVLDQLIDAASNSVPSLAVWTDAQIDEGVDALRNLQIDNTLLAAARASVDKVADCVTTLKAALASARRSVEAAGDNVAARQPLIPGMTAKFQDVDQATQQLREASERYAVTADPLRRAVEDATRDHIAISGLVDVAYLMSMRTDLIIEVVAEATRQRTIRRLNAAEKALREAAGSVLDARFNQMSDTIERWWSTIRPEELVGFGGVKRRAGGALFVNLVAALRTEPTGLPVEREALGVYSDSQLNALGLSIFLSRTELLKAPVVVLDDPIPGSDAGHRLTFVQNTLGALLNSKTQVILTTFDSKLAEWTNTNHGGADFLAYKLDLIDIVAGTEPTQTTDTFGQLMLDAEESLHAPTAKGRRAACTTLRSAAERLAKQIIATGQTAAGTSTTVADVKATQLGDLLPLLSPFVVEGSSEKGQWKTLPKVLTPGNHDDDVPSTSDLKVIFGNLRRISKLHRKHWPGGLVK